MDVLEQFWSLDGTALVRAGEPTQRLSSQNRAEGSGNLWITLSDEVWAVD